MKLYFKAAINEAGFLTPAPYPDAVGSLSLSACTFTYQEAAHLELMGCRPVAVVVVRAYPTRHAVGEEA